MLLEQMRNEDNTSFQRLYAAHFPNLAAYIRRNSGTYEDAEDVFQEAIVVVLNNVRNPDFELTSSLKTYLFAISRNIWLKRLRENKQRVVLDFEVDILEAQLPSIEDNSIDTLETKVETWLQKITKNCQ